MIFRFWLILPVTMKGLCHTQSASAFLKWIGAPSIGTSPSISPTTWSRNENLRSSPSVMTSSPIPSCIAIAWSTARSSIRLKSGAGSWPAAYASLACCKYLGLSSEPMTSEWCVCGIASLPERPRQKTVVTGESVTAGLSAASPYP